MKGLKKNRVDSVYMPYVWKTRPVVWRYLRRDSALSKMPRSASEEEKTSRDGAQIFTRLHQPLWTIAKGQKDLDSRGIEPRTTPMLREYYTTKPQAQSCDR